MLNKHERFFSVFLHQRLSFITPSTSCLSIQYIITQKLTRCIHKKIQILNTYNSRCLLFCHGFKKYNKLNKKKVWNLDLFRHQNMIFTLIIMLFDSFQINFLEYVMILEMNEIIFSLKIILNINDDNIQKWFSRFSKCMLYNVWYDKKLMIFGTLS